MNKVKWSSIAWYGMAKNGLMDEGYSYSFKFNAIAYTNTFNTLTLSNVVRPIGRFETPKLPKQINKIQKEQGLKSRIKCHIHSI